MDHASWKAFIKLSLVSIPVEGYTAAKPGREQITFHQLHEGHARIQYRKVCPTHGEVPNDEIVKGYEYAKGEYVIVDPDEFERIQMGGERSIAIQTFVAPREIDPLYFSGKAYYLLPDGAAGEKPYALLQEAMSRRKVYAVAEMVLSGRQELMVLRPVDHILTISGIRYKSQLREASEFSTGPEQHDFSAKELELTGALMDATTTKRFDLGRYHDVHDEQLRELIESKLAGKEITVPEVEEPRAVINLMDALRESLARAKKPGRKASTRAAAPRGQKEPRPAGRGKPQRAPATTSGRTGGKKAAHRSAAERSVAEKGGKRETSKAKSRAG